MRVNSIFGSPEVPETHNMLVLRIQLLRRLHWEGKLRNEVKKTSQLPVGNNTNIWKKHNILHIIRNSWVFFFSKLFLKSILHMAGSQKNTPAARGIE